MKSTGSDDLLFGEFKVTFRKRYNSALEEATRFAIFRDNMAVARRLSDDNPLATFGTFSRTSLRTWFAHA
jgi:hypothetical protein